MYITLQEYQRVLSKTRFIEAHLEVISRVQYLVLHMHIHTAWLAHYYDHAINKLRNTITSTYATSTVPYTNNNSTTTTQIIFN